MTREELLDLFENIQVWRRGDERAPHKPLLLLYVLGRCRHDDQRLIPFEEIDEQLSQLLEEFGPQRKAHHPEYPFWRLQNDNLWTIPNPERFERRAKKKDAKKSELIDKGAVGGFPKPIYTFLRQHQDVIALLAKRPLAEHFPASLHDDILSAVGLELPSPDETTAPDRDPAFRERVLVAYGYRCAVCGYDLKLKVRPIGLEAAHVKWHQYNGPAIESNGLALCVLHHRLLDRGAWSLSDDYRIMVSEQVHGSSGLHDWVLRYHAHPIENPIRDEHRVKAEYLAWHREEVFRKPRRPMRSVRN